MNGPCPQCDIQGLFGRYCWLVDNQRWSEWARCFSTDAVFDVPGSLVEGRVGIESFVQGNFSRYRMIRHLQHLPFIEVEGDTARSRSHFEFKGISGSGREFEALGSYDDRLAVADGEWLIANRKVTFEFYVPRGGPWVAEDHRPAPAS